MKYNLKRLVSGLILTALLVPTIACSNPAQDSEISKEEVNQEQSKESGEQKESKKSFTDYSGKVIELPDEVNKISCALPALENTIILLGAKDKLATAMPSANQNPWVQKIFPGIKELPTVFTTPVEGNIEELIKIDPDIVLVGKEDLRDKMEESGLKSAFMTFATADEMMKTITDLGTILGDKDAEKAAKLNELYKKNIELVKERTKDIKDEDKPRVYYSANGLYNTEGSKTIIEDWMNNSGCVNVAGENGVEGSFKDITPEQLVEWNPDIIVLRDYATLKELQDDERLKNVKAVVNDKDIVSPRGVFAWTTGSGIIMHNLYQAKINYPDLFEDIDIKQEAKDFYKNFYEYDLTDEEVEEILNPKQ